MSVFKGICTDYVSDIDRLFHAPDKKETSASKAKQREIAKDKHIAHLRDRSVVGKPVGEAHSLWEDF